MNQFIRLACFCSLVALAVPACQPKLEDAPAPMPQQAQPVYPAISETKAPEIELPGATPVIIPARRGVGNRFEYPVNSGFKFSVKVNSQKPLRSFTVTERYPEIMVQGPGGSSVPYEVITVTRGDLPAGENTLDYEFSSSGRVPLTGNPQVNRAVIIINANDVDGHNSFRSYELSLIKVTSHSNKGLYANDALTSASPIFVPGTDRGSFFDSFTGTVNPRQAAVPATVDITYALLVNGTDTIPTFLSPEARRDTASLNPARNYVGAILPYLNGRPTLFRDVTGDFNFGQVQPVELYNLEINNTNAADRIRAQPGRLIAFLNANGERGLIQVLNLDNDPYIGKRVTFNVKVLRYQGA